MRRTKVLLMIFLSVFVFFILTSCHYIRTSPVITIEPYLIYRGDNTEMTVIWHLLEDMDSEIEWGYDSGYSLGIVETKEIDIDHTHIHTIRNLNPGRKYYYRVTFDGKSYDGSFFAAPENDSPKISFFVYADTQDHPQNHNKVAKEIIRSFKNNEEYQTFILHGGDMVGDGDDVYSWADEFFSPEYPNIREMMSSIPMQACMGNHHRNHILFWKYFPYDFVNGAYYSFDYGPAHITVIDQYSDFTIDSNQIKWVEKDLASSGKKWKFLLFHEPGYSAGLMPINHVVKRSLQPLCTRYGVSIVFTGHNHYYAKAEINGVYHITTGGGGGTLDKFSLDGISYIDVIDQSHHFCRVEISGNRLYFKAIRHDGTVIDSFTITQ